MLVLISNRICQKSVLSVCFLENGSDARDCDPLFATLAWGQKHATKERRDTGQNDVLRAWLDKIVDPTRPLVELAVIIDWQFFGEMRWCRSARPACPSG